MIGILEQVLKLNRPLVILAEDIDGDALATLVVNRLRGSGRLVAVKAPGFGDNRKAMMADIAVLTGAQVLSEDTDLKLEDATLEQLGSCKSISISKEDTMVLGGAGSETAVQERCDFIRSSIQETKSVYEQEKFAERLAKLSGGVAVINIGGASEVEVGEKKDRVDDALNATRAAVERGIVPGGGTALLYASQVLDGDKIAVDNEDQAVGVRLVQRAIRVPCEAIVNNAGGSGQVVVQRLLEDAAGNTKATRGMNVATGVYVDMIEEGVIDPTKVVTTALIDASGVASLMSTTECVIVNAPAPEAAPAAPAMPGGMGGMGGMGGGMF
jgi:chaperonin GroEL